MFDGATKAPDEAARGEYSTDLFTRKAVEAIGSQSGTPSKKVVIVDSGELPMDEA